MLHRSFYLCLVLSMLLTQSLRMLRSSPARWGRLSFVRAQSSNDDAGGLGDLVLPAGNLAQIYSAATEWLTRSGVEDADDSARHMIAHATQIGTRRSDFFGNQQRPLSPTERHHLSLMCAQRARREPVQYIVGNWDFYGLTLNCRRPVLIPRPETEELVERILASGVLQGLRRPRILDVGSGTGAIGLALLSQLPTAECVAIDINPVAVELARENAAALGMGGEIAGLGMGIGGVGAGAGDSGTTGVRAGRYRCEHVDFRTFVKQQSIGGTGAGVGASVGSDIEGFDLIVSNPPYIPSAVVPTLQAEVRDYEDPQALDGGSDGLDIVRDIITLAPALLRGTHVPELWLEVSEEHPAMIEAWVGSAQYVQFVQKMQREFGVFGLRAEFVSGMADLSGNPRFARLRYI
ncbi:S-adenosyl-L-methionine-dependent methyltransferase [Ochromonadaceae sp. CCMP2298]|nr:S-adenosyl-L-methionine-dependent methyltransferase [Ochromonadaceae sp. CCMP2298]